MSIGSEYRHCCDSVRNDFVAIALTMSTTLNLAVYKGMFCNLGLQWMGRKHDWVRDNHTHAHKRVHGHRYDCSEGMGRAFYTCFYFVSAMSVGATMAVIFTETRCQSQLDRQTVRQTVRQTDS